MASITNGVTSVTLGGLFGPVNPSGLTAVEITRDGVAGMAFKLTGYRGEPWQARSWATASNATNLGLAKLYYLALKNSVVTITDDSGNTWYNIFVRDVQITRTNRHTCAPDSSAFMIEAVWTFQSVAVSYA